MVSRRLLAKNDGGKLTEHLIDDGTNRDLVAMAPHGGYIEPGTGEQAQVVAEEYNATAWYCRGVHESNSFKQWHIESHRIHPTRFPLLNSITTRRFSAALSFHGASSGGILVGGLARPMVKNLVADEISRRVGVDVAVAPEDDEYAGTDPFNVVNWIADGPSIQLEQGRDIRDKKSGAVANAAAGVLTELTERQPEERAPNYAFTPTGTRAHILENGSALCGANARLPIASAAGVEKEVEKILCERCKSIREPD